MRHIVYELGRTIESYERGFSLRKRVRIWYLQRRFRTFQQCLELMPLSEDERFAYIQLLGEFHSAKLCMTILLDGTREETSELLL